MKSTALGAENIIFISDAHEKFYYEKLQEVRYQDVYHKALCYCLGINGDTRKNADRIYNFKTGSVKTKCLHEGWQTSGSLKVVRMAFNLYCNSTPSVWDYEDAEEQVNECRQYTVEDIFCCVYAPYFWQAIQIRYPEYVVYNQKLHAMLGGIKDENAASVDSADLVGQAAGDSGRTVQRYIRLTCLIPELLKLLDEGKINFTVGVSLTYLSETEQIWVKDCIVSGASSVTGSMATKLKQYSDEGNLTELAVQLILNEKKTETGKVTLTEKKIRKYFPKEYNREQIEQVIYELLDNWKKSQ